MTEKTVAYYEEIVRQEIADYDNIKIGDNVKHKIDGDIRTVVGFLSTAPDEIYGIQIFGKPYTDVHGELYTIEGEDWIDKFYELYEHLSYEIRPHHILQWAEKNKVPIAFTYISLIVTEKTNNHTHRDLSKPFSEQADTTKIALGKVVEEVLAYKDK